MYIYVCVCMHYVIMFLQYFREISLQITWGTFCILLFLLALNLVRSWNYETRRYDLAMLSSNCTQNTLRMLSLTCMKIILGNACRCVYMFIFYLNIWKRMPNAHYKNDQGHYFREWLIILKEIYLQEIMFLFTDPIKSSSTRWNCRVRHIIGLHHHISWKMTNGMRWKKLVQLNINFFGLVSEQPRWWSTLFMK